MIGYVYLLTVGKSKYVGSTIQEPKTRLNQHVSKANTTQGQKKLHDKMLEVGASKVTMRILEKAEVHSMIRLLFLDLGQEA